MSKKKNKMEWFEIKRGNDTVAISEPLKKFIERESKEIVASILKTLEKELSKDETK